jgi:hypothetical protein
MTQQATPEHDDGFDFLLGSWRVEHRYLAERLTGCAEWREFSGSATCERILDGVGNRDEITLEPWQAVGTTVRIWDAAGARWWLSWSSTRSPRFEPPVVGGFDGQGRGSFFGADSHEGVPICVRYLWDATDPAGPRWEQAFSADGGASWEPNWQMTFLRVAGSSTHP